jgi:hypothetical protein
MLIAVIVVFISNHLIRLTFEAHALSTSIAGHSIAPIRPFDRHSTLLVRTPSNVVLLHELLEHRVSSLFGLFTGHIRMIVHLKIRKSGTLH